MEHSRLLKYLLPGSGLIKMTDTPTIKLNYEYKNPNIESEVPGSHELREAPTQTIDDGEATFSGDNKVEVTENFTLSPVITVTKKEATFTKGDMKLQKVTVTEDISETDIQNGGTYVRREVRRATSHQETRNGRDIDDKEEKINAERKTKTRIPKLRQTVEKLRERRHSKDTEKNEAPPFKPTPRRSSIPKLKKEHKIQALAAEKEIVTNKEKVINKEEVTKPDDEFDKLYEDIVERKSTSNDIDENILNTKIEDPDKLEIKFEEIIHDYEENNIHPIHVEKVKQSKIPFLKRKSEHDIEIPKTREITTKITYSGDKAKIRNAVSKLREPSVRVTAESSVKKHVVTSKVTKTVTTIVSDGINEVTTSEEMLPVNVESTTESIEIVETNISDDDEEVEYRVKDTVRIVTPDFRKHFSEMANMYKGNYDNDGEVTITEIKDDHDSGNSIPHISPEYDITEPNYEISSPAIEDVNQPTEEETVHITEIKEIETIDSIVEERDSGTEEDIPVIRGKVGRMINRIASIESKDEPKKDFTDEIPEKKSVLSKIAMFERQETKEPSPKTKIPRSETKPLKIYKDIETENVIIDTKPKIVEEVLKAVLRETEPIANDNINQNSIEQSYPSIEEAQILDEILEPLDKELEAIDHEQANDEEVTEPQIILDSKYDDNKDEIADANHIESVVMTTKPTVIKEASVPRKSAPNDYQHKVEIQINTPLIVEEHKAIKKIDAHNEIEFVEDIPPKIDLINNKISDTIPSNEAEEVIETDKTVDDIVTLPQSPKEHAVIYERVDSFNTIDNEPKIISYKDVNNIIRQPEIRNKLHYERGTSKIDTELKGVEYKDRNSVTELVATITNQFTVDARDLRRGVSTSNFESNSKLNKVQNDPVRKLSRKENDDVFEANIWCTDDKLSKFKKRHESSDVKRAKSLAELDLGDAVKGQVNRMIVSMKSIDKLLDVEKREVISVKERPRKRTVSEKIALFESKLTPIKLEIGPCERPKAESKQRQIQYLSEEAYAERISELNNAKLKYGKMSEMPTFELRNGVHIPVYAVGTALLDSRLITHIIMVAIDLGYRAIDTAFVYGNEKEVGAAIKAKIEDGTVRREDLFIINKLWSTFHRQDLVEKACRTSLTAMGLDYFDLYLIHNPMSFKEGPDPFPKIATVLQYSAHDFMDAWFGMEHLVSKGLVRSIGLSNFNSAQVLRVVEKGRVKPVVNQVECHPYLSQHRLESFCSQYGVKLCCYGVLGSVGTPLEYRSGLPPVINDALVQVMASGLGVTPAQLLIRYQIQCGHSVVVKSSTGAHLWDNLQALTFTLSQAEMDALNALNRNKRTFTFKGMGDTHKNYPYSIAF